ncbi:HDIG domain-containing protein [Patescibacteria group bacterium]|nr:HDIG domain-containing protein [Patescibacteria group bacterium]
MTRKEALKLVEEKIQNKNLIKHCLAVEVVMKELAKYFNENTEKWALAGLLHDIDYEETKDTPEKHSLLGAETLQQHGIDSEIITAIKAHNEIHGLPREDKMTKALFCSDPITGLIVAATLVMPKKKIIDLSAENVLNRYKEKGFARGASRETIATCEELDLSLEEFVRISLRAMQSISKELGL